MDDAESIIKAGLALPTEAAEEAYTATLAQLTGNLPGYLHDRYQNIRARLEDEYASRTQERTE